MTRGKFIVFEGIDGCGKGTQMKFSAGYIFGKDKSYSVLMDREPTRNFQEIRERMASSRNTSDDREWYAQQFTEDRIQHCEKISQILEWENHLLCDRYYHSTLTYQTTQGLRFEDVLEMQRQNGILVPDLTIIFDLPTEIAFARRRSGGATDVFDKDLEFQERLRNAYLELPSRLPHEKIFVVNSYCSPERVFERVKPHLNLELI